MWILIIKILKTQQNKTKTSSKKHFWDEWGNLNMDSISGIINVHTCNNGDGPLGQCSYEMHADIFRGDVSWLQFTVK